MVSRRGRFLIVTWDGGGNVPPAMALGRRLVLAGHQVNILGPSSAAPGARTAGLHLEPYTAVPGWKDGQPIEDDDARFHEVLNGDGTALNAVNVARRWQPDVVIADCMMGAALAAAEHLALPTAVLVHVLYRPFVDQWGQFVLDAARPRAALALPPLSSPAPADVLARTDLVLALVPPGFDVDGNALPANTSYVGPILSPDPIGALPDWPGPSEAPEPLVLVSFSTTIQGQRTALPPVMAALGSLPVRGVLTLGGALSPDEVAAPANVAVFDYLPHAAVLASTALVVCHGGLSTVMAALSHGVPLLCLPQGREQPLNAARVEAVGAGRMLPSSAAPETIAEAVTGIIEDPAYRRAAAGVAEKIKGCENQPVRLLEALLA